MSSLLDAESPRGRGRRVAVRGPEDEWLDAPAARAANERPGRGRTTRERAAGERSGRRQRPEARGNRPAVRAPRPKRDPLVLSPDLPKQLLVVALRPCLIMLVATAVLVLATLLVANGNAGGAGAAISASWLAVHQVPVTVGTTTIAVLPLLPTALMAWLTGRTVFSVARPGMAWRELGLLVAASVAGPLVISAVCLAEITSRSAESLLAAPDPVRAVGAVIAIHVLSAGAGVACRLWRELAGPHARAKVRVPDTLAAAVVAAVRALGLFAVIGVVVVLVLMLGSWSRVTGSLDGYRGGTDNFALILLSLLYLPNVAISALAVSVGGTAGVGAATTTLFGVVPGPLPKIPVLAVVPQGPPAQWWLIALAVPVAVAVFTGLECARRAGDRLTAMKAAGLASVLIAAGLAATAWLAGGDLGTFGFVGADAGVFGSFSFGWLLVVGVTSAAFTAGARHKSQRAAAARTTGAASTTAEAAVLAAEDVDEEPDDLDVADGPRPTSSIVCEAELVEPDADQLALESGEQAGGSTDAVDAEVVELD